MKRDRERVRPKLTDTRDTITSSMQRRSHEPSGREWDEDTGYSETDVFIFRSRVAVCIVLECPGRMLTRQFFRSPISKLKVHTLWSLLLG
ncbi:hypothetical protein I315_03209 [Cryptococcus gattii Ru294]|uniref:Uncharacterized protein n=1 Tax=Cryptococcus gattii EJB2 TaxID=1296103 RepID=A0ABR5BWD0_9TREE|nr:hypothetical protein I315_03209 [Cryptococcus gattii Ru294]KIR79949.1 hypothetical protein I306_02911 [Cryptococcus gattii EJB2]KIY34409.1 hypothetical protein I305_03191 [Cryptococcus gattii E566]KJE05232.1 hypothetical protein I311_00909 [Cryptococcus gattii NT-10]